MLSYKKKIMNGIKDRKQQKATKTNSIMPTKEIKKSKVKYPKTKAEVNLLEIRNRFSILVNEDNQCPESQNVIRPISVVKMGAKRSKKGCNSSKCQTSSKRVTVYITVYISKIQTL